MFVRKITLRGCVNTKIAHSGGVLIRKVKLKGCVKMPDNTLRECVNTQDNTLPWMDFPGGFSPKQGGGCY